MKDPELARLVGLVDPSEKGCATCHDASSPSLKAFDFVAKLKRSITGRSSGRGAPKPPRRHDPGARRRFVKSATEAEQYPKSVAPEVAFAGRIERRQVVR